MIFRLLILLAALSLAAVAGWFSIIGMTAVYAGAPMLAFILGAVIELAKLVMISWLYQSWKTSHWLLKLPILTLVIAIMMATSMSVFGFLSKAHLEQGAATIDNSPKIERLDEQIAREKSRVADDEKVITQLDATVNSFIGKDNGDRALQVRRSQDRQRSQLRTDISEAQKRIDQFSIEKAPLAAEVRKLQLDVGPIRYIGELIYGDDNTDKNIERAVKLFSGLLVLILDPSAVMLLIAFNHTLAQQNEKKEKNKEAEANGRDLRKGNETYKQIWNKISKAVRRRFSKTSNDENDTDKYEDISEDNGNAKEAEIHLPILSEPVDLLDEEKKGNMETDSKSIQKTVSDNDLFTSGSNNVFSEVSIHKIDYQTYLSADDIKWPTTNEKKETILQDSPDMAGADMQTLSEIPAEYISAAGNGHDVSGKIRTTLDDEIQSEESPSEDGKKDEIDEKEQDIFQNTLPFESNNAPPAIIRSPSPSRVESNEDAPTTLQSGVESSTEGTTVPLVEVTEVVPPVTNYPHFIPQKARNFRAVLPPVYKQAQPPPPPPKSPVVEPEPVKTDKYPKVSSWINEFKRPHNE